MSNQNRFSKLVRWLFVALLAVQAGGAFAQSRTLDAPRAAGTVGERFDGYAAVRDPASGASLAPLVTQINAERQKVYAERAATDRAPIGEIGRVYAGEIFKSAPAGTWFLQETGQWVQKK